MKPILVGTYNLGLRPIRLYAHPDKRDGSVKTVPKDRGTTTVDVGIDQIWGRTLGTLLHESYEIVLIDLGTRYEKNPTYSDESSDFMFFMSHNMLGEAHEIVGDFLIEAVPDFQKIHNKYGRRSFKKAQNK